LCWLISTEGLGFVAVLEPFDGEIGDEVGGVALVLDLLAVADHRRVVVDALAREDVPVVEAGGVADQVPFADDGGLVAGLLQQLGEGLLRAVEAVAVVVEAVQVAVFAGLDDGAAGAADGVGHETALELHALLREPVHVRRLQQLERMP
jgi:hypothetical protein